MAAFSIVNVLIVMTIFVAIPVLIGVYVYRDATQRGMNALLWVLIAVLVPSLVGLIIYLIVRINYSNLKCPNCAAAVTEQFVVCPKCGTKLQESCPSCGNPIEPDWSVCPRCAAKLPVYDHDNGYTPPIRKKNLSLGIIVLILLIPFFLILLAAFNAASIGTSMSYSTESLSVEDFAGHQKIEAWLEKCDEEPLKAHALRYNTEEYGRTMTRYLIYLPSLDGTASMETIHPRGFLSRNLEIRIQEVSNQFNIGENYKLVSISYSTNAKGHPGLNVFVNGQKMSCEITDIDYNPTITYRFLQKP